MKHLTLVKFHKQYIQGTEEKATIILLTVLLCNTTNLVMKTINLSTPKIHASTKMLKHLYDSKPAEEYEFILNNLAQIVRFPDSIYENKEGKRGQFCFVKRIKDHDYFCSIETTQEINSSGKTEEMNFVATAFRIRKGNYLRDYKLLWSRKDDLPSS